jgi:hypothetical protein
MRLMAQGSRIRGTHRTVLWTAVAMTIALLGCNSSDADTSDARAKARTPATHAVTLTISGEEYEHLGGAPLTGTMGTECPPSHGVPSVPAECWIWTGRGLGEGSYVNVFQTFTIDKIAFTFTLTDSSGDLLNGSGAVRLASEDPTPPQALGHQRRFPGTLTVADGTGRFAGIAGQLTGRFTSTVVHVDDATGIINRRVAGEFTGELRSSRK